MALKKNAGNVPASDAPAFEDETTGGDVAQATATEVVEEEVAATPAAEVKAVEEATTAIAKAAGTSLGKPMGSKYQAALQEYKDQIDPSTLDFDTFPRITVGLDGFSDQDETELGKEIKIELMSYNERYVITTGEQNNAEANELVRYSLDGVHIDGTGELCTDYVAKLRDVDGYENAAIKKYYNLYGFLIATSESGKLEELVEDDREIVAIQVPPRSVGKFTGYQINQGVKASRGVEVSNILLLKQNKVKGKTTSYAEIQFSAG